MLSIEKITKEESDRLRFILLGFIALTVVSVFFTPSDMIAEMFPDLFRYESSCLMLNIAGIPCPFCGMSRAWREFTRMNYSAAMYYNPSSIVFFLGSSIIVAGIFVLSLFNRRIKFESTGKNLIAIVSVLFIIWILNILYGHHL